MNDSEYKLSILFPYILLRDFERHHNYLLINKLIYSRTTKDPEAYQVLYTNGSG